MSLIFFSSAATRAFASAKAFSLAILSSLLASMAAVAAIAEAAVGVEPAALRLRRSWAVLAPGSLTCTPT